MLATGIVLAGLIGSAVADGVEPDLAAIARRILGPDAVIEDVATLEPRTSGETVGAVLVREGPDLGTVLAIRRLGGEGAGARRVSLVLDFENLTLRRPPSFPAWAGSAPVAPAAGGVALCGPDRPSSHFELDVTPRARLDHVFPGRAPVEVFGCVVSFAPKAPALVIR